jgi:hypothetical protein
MKNYFFILPGGGIFSRLLQFGILPLADIDFDHVYLSPAGFAKPDDPNDEFCRRCYEICMNNEDAMRRYGIADPYAHVINYALEQRSDIPYEYRGYLPLGPRYDKENRIEDSARFLDYKRVLGKLKFTSDVYTASENSVVKNNISEKTIGVHVRLTSMNLLHHNLYQKITTQDYIRVIEQDLATGNYDNIFVASDNNESLQILKKRFGNLLSFNEDFLRYEKEEMSKFEESMIEYEWFYQKRAWIETFADTMSLSRCGTFICRESNLANMAILFSNTFKNINRVYHV